jgi:hypothetical protein
VRLQSEKDPTPGRRGRRPDGGPWTAILRGGLNMLRKFGLLVLVSLLAAAAPVRLDDAYPIKIKKGGQGDVSTQDKQSTETASVKLEDPDGKVLQDKKEERVITEAFKETIQEKVKGKKATKLRREYTKATVKAGKNETTLPYQGKTVLIEKKDGKYHFTIEGGEELMGKDAELFDKSFNKADDSDDELLEKAILPQKPVKVNETWKIDSDALVKSLTKDMKQALPVDKSKAGGTGKLIRAYKKDDKQFGVLDVKIDLPLKGEFPIGAGQKAPIQEGSKMTMRMEVDTCIDGTATDTVANMSMEMDLVATIKGPDGKDYKMTVHSAQKEKSNEKDLSKK